MSKVVLVFEGYSLYKNNDGWFEIGLKDERPTHLTGTSSKLLSVLKFLILRDKWSDL